MTEEINPSELGAFTNNLPNKEGIKKLVSSLEGKQEKLTAGTNITITDENVISAASGKVYTAGDNISISEQDVISATDTKYTAGTGIYISEQNVISALGGSDDWTEVDVSTTQKYSDAITTYKNGYDILLYGEESSNYILGINTYCKKDANRSDYQVIGGRYGSSEDIVSYGKLYYNTSNGRPTLRYISVGSSNVVINISRITDFDGNPITSSNVSTFIDSSTYKALKPFIVGGNVAGINNSVVYYNMTAGSTISGLQLSVKDIYDAIIASTNIEKNYTYYLISVKEFYSTRLFVRESNIPVEPPTP